MEACFLHSFTRIHVLLKDHPVLELKSLALVLIIVAQSCATGMVPNMSNKVVARRKQCSGWWTFSVVAVLCCCCCCCDASKFPALFVFGDSTVDTGNLKYHSTVSVIMSGNLPYGRDFVPPGPTGRASNGKLATDFLAEFLGLPTPVNSYQPAAEGGRLLQGMNFAAGGSGFLNETGAVLGTIPFSQQLDAFEDALHHITQAIRPERVSEFLATSLFVVSTGNNDMFNYIYNPKVRLQYDANSYNELVLAIASSQIQRLYEMGARKLIVLSVGPLGCTPAILSLYDSSGDCVKEVNDHAFNFNSGLQSSLSLMRRTLHGIKLVYGNAYELLLDAVQNPSKYGFEDGNVACCGFGRFRGSTTCSNLTEVCPASDRHVFWDLVHPTQAMYKITADKLISGPPSLAYPFNLLDLINL